METTEQLAAMTEVAQTALGRWNKNIEQCSLVKYRENAIFRLQDADGKSFALRVHRIAYHTDAELAAELHWMSALLDSGIDVPAVIPAKDGSLFVKEEGRHTDGLFQVDMLGWLDGKPLGSIETGLAYPTTELDALYAHVGRLAGQLHNHSSTWTLPKAFDRHAWDAEGLFGTQPFWGQFRDLPALSIHLPIIEEACRQADQSLKGIGKTSESFGLIHADLVPENILRRDQGLCLIDFDDAGFGWHMFELATALFFLADQPYYTEIKNALLRGYRSVRPLAEQHWQQLPLFVFLRSLTYLSWVRTRSETETAQQLTPFLIEKSVVSANAYLAGK